jgi:hypothetical protein
VHSIYDQLGTMTGRFVSRNPNLQNLPRPDKKHPEKSVRSLFVAPPGRKLIIADFSQICQEHARRERETSGPRCTSGLAQGFEIDDLTTMLRGTRDQSK